MSAENSYFKPLENGSGYGVQPIGTPPEPSLGGDMHDTFRVDPKGTITDGHTTVRIPGGLSVKLPWEQ